MEALRIIGYTADIGLTDDAYTRLQWAVSKGITTDDEHDVINSLCELDVIEYCTPNGGVLFDRADLKFS